MNLRYYFSFKESWMRKCIIFDWFVAFRFPKDTESKKKPLQFSDQLKAQYRQLLVKQTNTDIVGKISFLIVFFVLFFLRKTRFSRI